VPQNPDHLGRENVGATRRNIAPSTIALAIGAAATLAVSVTDADATAREISASSYGFADSLWTQAEIERSGTLSPFGGEGAHQCWVQCRPVFGATIVRRSDLLTSNNADLSTRKTADANGHQMGVGGTTLVERLESDASGSLTNWVVVSERTVDEDGWHSWSRLSGVPSDALWRPSDLYRFESSSFSTDLLGETPTTPEASTWVMMLIGFAGLGLAGYRSSRTSCRPIPIS
jgi:hypothetical protein